MKIVILLMEQNKQLIPDITKYVSNKFGITESLDISIKNLIRLPRNELGYTVNHLGECIVITDYYGVIGANVKRVDDVNDVSSLAEIIASNFISPKVYFTDDLTVAKRWLDKFDKNYPIIACDFETNDLTLPMFNSVNSIAIGWSYTQSVVIVLKDTKVLDYVMNWLVTTECRQVWHNVLFDARFVIYHTNRLPKHMEDSQLLAQVYKNHINPIKRKTGLKELANVVFGDWASIKCSFDIYDTTLNSMQYDLIYRGKGDYKKYNLALIYYNGIDVNATKFVWDKFDTEIAHPSEWIFQTSEPRYNTEGFNQRYYYDFVLKPAIPMIIEMLHNGQVIDLDIVSKLKQEIEEFNAKTLKQINSYKLVQDFQAIVDKERIDKFIEPVKKALKVPKYAGYKNTVKMRTFVVNYWDKSNHESIKATELKSIDTEISQLLIDKQFDNNMVIEASNAYEEEECLRQNTNAGRIDKLAHPENYVDVGFNPFNYSQLTRMWKSFGLVSDEMSKTTKEPSYSGKVLERLSRITAGDIGGIIKLYLDLAQSKNMITQYIPKYYGSSYNGRLYYALRLFGTTTARLSGKAAKMSGDVARHQTAANGVTQPVGHKVYGKTVKSMFKSAPGKVLAYIDYNGLENHISALLTKDEMKIDILNGKYEDMHTLHACYYFKPAIEKQFGINLSHVTASVVSELYHNKDFGNFRTKGKPVTFSIDYGSMPPLIAKSINIPIKDAEDLHHRYHYELYPGVSKFREEYVVPTATKQGFLHLNWGLRIYSDDINKDVRTLFNANFQGYTSVTQIAAVEFRKYLIDNNLTDSIKAQLIVHDALVYECDDNAETLKLINDVLVEIMCRPFLKNNVIDLHGELDVGYNMRDMETLKNNASIEDIEETLNKLRK